MKRRGLLLDRDGVINIDHSYVRRREDFQFLPGLFPFLRTAQDMGFRLAVLTNQSGVARGFYTEEDYNVLTGWMRSELAREGIALDLILACFEYTQGTLPAYTRDSFWRKPNPGMVIEAVQCMNLNPARSAMIGDKLSDMQAAQSAGIGLRILLGDKPAQKPEGATIAQGFDEALEALRRFG